MKKIVALWLCCLLAPWAYSQKLAWGVEMDTRFDNREYNSQYNQSQTIFAAVLAPEIGIRWDEKNVLMGGLAYTYHMGGESFEERPQYTLYYEYKSRNFRGRGGSFPRTALIGEYPTAFFYDSIAFFDRNIDGALFQYFNPWFKGEFFCDWNSQQSSTRREKFLLCTAGKANYRWLYGGWHFYMYHFAGTFAGENVYDNGLSHLYIGANLSKMTPLDSLTIQAGVLTGHEQFRARGDGFQNTPGLQLQLNAEYRHFGIEQIAYWGERKMNFYNQFSNQMYWGDPYYRSTRYFRTEVYWKIAQTKHVDFRLNSVCHWDEHNAFGWQQLLTVAVKFDH